MSVYVGVDVHRKRSQIAVVDEAGEVQVNRNVTNGAVPILEVIGGLDPSTAVAFEAAYGWGWLVELLEDYGFEPHLVHPTRCKAIAAARLKNDKVDAATLAQLLRADLLPEAWIAPAGDPSAAGVAAPPGPARPAAHHAADPNTRRAGRLRP
ncbi:MAG: transposase [Actinomycetota bacterium]|nr:transposase [Actinomycetota bacterium]